MCDCCDSMSEEDKLAAAQVGVDVAFKAAFNEGCCACCMNPVYNMTYGTANHIIARYTMSKSCCCSIRLCCPFVCAQIVGNCMECITVCEGEAGAAKASADQAQTPEGDQWGMICGAIALLGLPASCLCCLGIESTYYGCLMCIC